MDALDWLRVTLAAHPLVTAAIALVVAGPVAALTAVEGGAGRRRADAGLAVLVIAAYVVLASAYAVDDHFFDPAEPTMPAVGWVAAHGAPVYPAIDAAERYAHVYGPLAFLVPGAALRVLGPTLLVAKGLGVVVALASLAILFVALARAAGRRHALLLIGACTLVWLAFRDYTFWTRPEPFLLALVACGLWIAVARHGAAAAALVGVAAGLAVGFKITGALYIAPIVAGLVARDGWRSAAIAAAAGIVAAGAPMLLPNVSTSHYADWLALSARNGIVGSTLRQNVEWAIFLLLPLAAIDPRAFASLRGAALLASVAVVAVAAAKPGAGAYHLLPFVPVIAAWIADALTRSTGPGRIARAGLIAACLAIAAIAAVQQTSFVRVMAERRADDEGGDLRAYLASHPAERVQVGYARDDRRTFVRPLAVFATGLYLIDAPAVQEYQRSGLDVPPATIDAIRACRVETWLLPRGGAPFEGPNRYAPDRFPALFPPAFITAFTDTYAREGATRYFDVWRCRARPASP